MRLVLCSGCFDILHPGHLWHLQEAAQLGEYLIVALTSDRVVREAKGEGRPVHGQNERADMLRALRCVDQVWIYDESWPQDAIRRLRPAVYCKGIDYLGQDIVELQLVEELGGRVVFTATPKLSSTALMSSLAEVRRSARNAALAEAERLAAEVVTFPAGYEGRFEGYGPVKSTRRGADLAPLIRALKEG